MSSIFGILLKATPAIIGASVLVASNPLLAQTEAGNNLSQQSYSETNEVLEQINRYNLEGSTDSLNQVTNVNQFTDVQPTDWAYEALRGLVERYGCIAGYPDRTFRGNRALTRYEFAAGLFSCLTQIERLIAAGVGTTEEVGREDLLVLQRLIGEFEGELATLGTRVDNLEARLGTVEGNQFSTTTKLRGEAIFGITQAFGDNVAFNPSMSNVRDAFAGGATNSEGVYGQFESDNRFGTQGNLSDSNTTLSNRVRLNFDSSFTGRDRLRVRLQSGNFDSFGRGLTGTDSTRLGFAAFTGDGGNDVVLDDLNYRFPVGDRIRLHLGANGFSFDKVATVNNPFFESSGTGATNRFSRRNPAVYRESPTGAGIGAEIAVTDSIGLDLAYLVDSNRASNPTGLTNGLFQGNYSAAAQLNFSPIQNLDLALTYVRSWYERGQGVNLSGGTSSAIANNPFSGLNFETSNASDNVVANRYGAQANLKLGDRFNVGGWYGLIDAQADGRNADATITNWAAHAALLDFGKEGSVLGAIFGQVPKVTGSSGLIPSNATQGFEEEDSSYLLEVIYKYPLTRNILLTPSFYTVFNPNNTSRNDNVYVGVLRTTFTF